MEKVKQIAFIKIFSRQKTLNKKTPDSQLHFTVLTVHGWAFSLTDFHKFLKNITFPKFLVKDIYNKPLQLFVEKSQFFNQNKH